MANDPISSSSSIAEPAQRTNTNSSTTSTTVSTTLKPPLHSGSQATSSDQIDQINTNTAVPLGERTRSQSISYGDPRRKQSIADSDCPLCRDDRIHGLKEVGAAIKLTWNKNKKHLLITWLHVPVGVVLMLVVVWGIDLGIAKTPVRFPAAVLTMVIFLLILLGLDFLSNKFPGKDAKSQDVEASGTKVAPRVRKRFLDPFMAALAPPADFLLRNMSVMFTPSFIMIPAREVIPGREIGILAAYFTLTQVLGYVIPVLLCMLVDWLFGLGPRRKRAREAQKQFERLRQNSVSGAGLGFGHQIEKSLVEAGRVKDAPIVAGLLTTNLVAFAPLRPVQPNIDQSVPEDELVHMSHVAIEQARQQGMGPAVAPPSRSSTLLQTPKSDVSTFQHPARRHAHLKRAYSEGQRVPSSQRSTSGTSKLAAVELSTQEKLESEEVIQDGASQPLWRQRSMRGAQLPSSPPIFEGFEFPPREPASPEIGRPSIVEVGPFAHFSSPAVPQIHTIPPPPQPPAPARIAFDPILETAASIRAEDEDLARVDSQQASRRNSLFSPSAPGTRRNSLTIIPSNTSTRRNSKINAGFDDEKEKNPGGGKDGDNNTPAPSIRCRHNSIAESTISCGPNAVERLADWLGDLISPAIYALLVIVGLPLYFVLDFSLPLFLGTNLLVFIASITIVPAKIRRFAHPILTTSIVTVLILWAWAAMKGRGLKETLLQSYQVDAKYNQIWTPSGYSGPVPGAGDFLLSTLDAGIVALAVPCYRYRAELQESFFRLILVLFPSAVLSLFAWPALAHVITLDRSRSLAFAARFMSTPLAIELNETLGGDGNIVVILVVITGIVAAILKEPFFKMMRVSMDDHFIVGATFGATSGAIGASSLIARPKVMAVASLSFVIFGAMLLIAAAVPPLVVVVRQTAGF
ncbi:hypothetical protein OC846_001569 [Tilletia horrida]|uniref:LrgB-like protein n=1 Tax=Tilletia horrida TaxID=155126 RepID=A0AAN6GYQ3_9BASI|nr:hypothetical protein OC846_001569 [Tilletia horrida]KAK0568906.1 hypothetical protein OC861_001513 [Tilletia horrida]